MYSHWNALCMLYDMIELAKMILVHFKCKRIFIYVFAIVLFIHRSLKFAAIAIVVTIYIIAWFLYCWIAKIKIKLIAIVIENKSDKKREDCTKGKNLWPHIFSRFPLFFFSSCEVVDV